MSTYVGIENDENRPPDNNTFAENGVIHRSFEKQEEQTERTRQVEEMEETSGWRGVRLASALSL